MNPNPEQIQAIKNYVSTIPSGWLNPDFVIRETMQSDLYTNPVTQKTVIKEFDALAVFSGNQISASSLIKLDLSQTFASQVIPLINKNPHTTDDIKNLNGWASYQLIVGNLQYSEYDFLANSSSGIFNITELDPTYPSSVGWDVYTLGRLVDDFDLETARHN